MEVCFLVNLSRAIEKKNCFLDLEEFRRNKDLYFWITLPNKWIIKFNTLDFWKIFLNSRDYKAQKYKNLDKQVIWYLLDTS